MSRKSKGPRLWLKPEERDETGKIRKRAVWIIRDGSFSRVTGCAADERIEAEKALGKYITEKHAPGREKDIRAAEILVTDVLAIYQNEVVPKHARPAKSVERINQLAEWWAGKMLEDINGA